MTRTIQLRRPAASASDDEEHRLLRAARRRSGTSQPRCVSWAVPAQCDAQTSRRQRVARSWCGAEPAYGALNDGMRHQTGASAATTNAQVQSPQTGAAAALTLGLPPQPTSIATSPVPQKRKTARNRMDFIMPSLRSLVSRRTASGSTSSLHQAGQESKTPMIVVDSGFMRKCDTAPLALSTASSRTTLLAEPLQAINRLRVTPASSARSLCSRCSSLLSLQASGSRYSLHASTAAFVQCPVSTILCKLCLTDVVASDVCTLRQCSCVFCKQCMQAYVSFEITEGAYDISCPDAQCPAQGVLVPSEIEQLVDSDLVLKHNKYRLNREVDIDKFRTWCPKAGCETVCNLCPTERCSPQSIHCPTCASQFCSNCKRNWHDGTTCEEQARLSGADSPLGIPFDSDLIKCCPMCSVPIEKDEGCAQMMCKRCKHVFCWYCLASLDDDFLLRHYDKGPCKNKLGHSRASVIWHRTQVIGIFAGFGILLLVASPLLLLAAPCIVCCKCRICSGQTKLDNEEELAIDESAS